MASGDFAAEKFPDAGEMLYGGHARGDGRAAGRELVEDGNVEVAIQGERQGARDGRSSQDEDMRGVTLRRCFIHQPLALQNAEAVLLVNGDEAQAGEFDAVFNQRVRADDKLRFAGANAFEGKGFLRAFQPADEQLDAIAGFGEKAARRKKKIGRASCRERVEVSVVSRDCKL